MRMNLTPSVSAEASATRLLTLGEASRILGTTRRSVWAAVYRRRTLPAVRQGHSVRIRHADLARFIREQEKSAHVPAGAHRNEGSKP